MGEGFSPAGAVFFQRSKNEIFLSLLSFYIEAAQVSKKRENNGGKSHKKGTNYHKKGKVNDLPGPSITEKGNYHKKTLCVMRFPKV